MANGEIDRKNLHEQPMKEVGAGVQTSSRLGGLQPASQQYKSAPLSRGRDDGRLDVVHCNEILLPAPGAAAYERRKQFFAASAAAPLSRPCARYEQEIGGSPRDCCDRAQHPEGWGGSSDRPGRGVSRMGLGTVRSSALPGKLTNRPGRLPACTVLDHTAFCLLSQHCALTLPWRPP